MMEYILAIKLLMACAACICLWFMIRGLIVMQRINVADTSVLELQGMIRKLTPRGNDYDAVLTLNADDEVAYVDCFLPGPWLGKKQRQVTDLVPVYWQKGEKRAVAADTIRYGQRAFLLGVSGLVMTALMYVLIFWK